MLTPTESSTEEKTEETKQHEFNQLVFKREPTRIEKKYIKFLEKRREYLYAKIKELEEAGAPNGYLVLEVNALNWALDITGKWCVGFNQRLISKVEVMKQEQPSE